MKPLLELTHWNWSQLPTWALFSSILFQLHLSFSAGLGDRSCCGLQAWETALSELVFKASAKTWADCRGAHNPAQQKPGRPTCTLQQ